MIKELTENPGKIFKNQNGEMLFMWTIAENAIVGKENKNEG